MEAQGWFIVTISSPCHEDPNTIYLAGLDIIYKSCLVIPSNPIPTPIPSLKLFLYPLTTFNYHHHVHLSSCPYPH
ncbi:hypothetical protein I7I53_03849 [Histoplasma capsulatum var. duboisii H88]|uniref:Uncharacterized protein n=1 Tax=Ajellomyces capsulatus (strain H88) TaxID=544711 RepID=A0A8A1LTF8_AJEC8|nr:hypothetical protein I7I53_03849 [Histoplasma capsulatum var. duboisii H88]